MGDPRALLVYEGWARRLALALTRDTDLADEVLQDARTAYWRGAPSDPSKTRGWLRQVLRHLALNRARAARRRTNHEQSAASTEASGVGPDVILETLQAHEMLATLVAALDEPFRTVITLRFYDELEPAQIAERLGIPGGTVRWRLHEGLARLRAQLDQRHDGDRRAWAVLLTRVSQERREPGKRQHAGPGFPLAPLGASLFVAIAAGALWCAPAPSRPAGTETPAPRLPPVTAEATSATLQSPAARQGEGTPVAAAVQPATFAFPSWAVVDPSAQRTVAGRVQVAGRPLAGAEVELVSGMLPVVKAAGHVMRTGADGGFSFAGLAATNWILTARAAGHAPVVLYVDVRRPHQPVAPGDHAPTNLLITLPDCDVTISGLVSDVGGGPIAHARVGATLPLALGGVWTETNTQGWYELCAPHDDGLFHQAIQFEADGYGAVEARIAEQGHRQLDVALEPGGLVAGRALLATGEGTVAAGALVTIVPSDQETVPNDRPPKGVPKARRLIAVADEDGRFEIRGVPAGRWSMEAVSEGYASKRVAFGVNPPTLVTQNVQLHRLVEVRGEVRRQGSPVPWASVWWRPAGGPEWPSCNALTLADGTFRVLAPPGGADSITVFEWNPVWQPSVREAALSSPTQIRFGPTGVMAMQVELTPDVP